MDSSNKYVIDAEKTGKFIKYLRESHNMTQEELADKIFLTRKAVSKWETGRSVPSIDTLTLLSEILDVSFEELIAGEFLKYHGKKDMKYIFKSLSTKWRKVLYIGLPLLFLIVGIIYFVYNLNADKVYLINYEDENFTISNGAIFLSKKGSYVNIGNIYSDLKNIDSSTVFNVTLYYVLKDRKIELIHFNSEKAISVDKDTYVLLKDLERSHKFSNLYFEIKFTDKDGQTNSYDLALVVIKSPNNKIDNVFGDDALPVLHVESDNSEEIDLSFLFALDEEDLDKCYFGKKIKVDGKEYGISYDKDSLVVTIKYKRENRIMIYLKLKRIIFLNDLETIELNESMTINKSSLNEENYKLLLNIVKSLREVACSHLK